MRGPRIFVFGYHGWKNIGAETRLVAIVENLRRLIPDASITASTFDRHNLDYLTTVDRRAYFNPGFHQRHVRRLLGDADLLLLSEGNMFSERFSPLMIEGSANAVEEAARQGVKSVGLALDSGTVHPKRRERLVAAIEALDRLTLRAPQALDTLRGLGVRREIEVTADCALSMSTPAPELTGLLCARYGIGGGAVHAIAPVDFYMWPATVALIGRPSEYLRWPVKATGGAEVRRQTGELIDDWVRYTGHLLRSAPDVQVPLVVMDPSDQRIAGAIAARVGRPDRTPILDGHDLTPHEMSALIRRFDSLTTSRYHALVLSLAYATPFVALGHDTRTRFVAEQVGAGDAFVAHDDPHRVDRMIELHGRVTAAADEVRRTLVVSVAPLQAADKHNYELVRDLLDS
ncbi:polysaccharide pyruvyl transferase family protein [Tsukamurella soli]|uniref:Polysaccharide pyruvyl transferase domain-containing protein n=1 Tax=Tsukamurella soli TaxID=644556 RepID=A0ABP8J7T0_9ACTN